MKSKDIRTLVECACMLALATILSYIKVFELPFGGTITLCSMVPILYISYKYPLKWVLTTSSAYSLLQMLQSFYLPPTRNLINFIAVILLDYVIAFGILGMAGTFGKRFDASKGILVGSSIAVFGRFLCHFISGILIWGVYAPESQSVVIYSLIYNGSYMLIELIISLIVLLAISRITIRREHR